MSDEKALHRAMMDEASGIDATYTPYYDAESRRRVARRRRPSWADEP